MFKCDFIGSRNIMKQLKWRVETVKRFFRCRTADKIEFE